MDSLLKISLVPSLTPSKSSLGKHSWFRLKGREPIRKFHAIFPNGSVPGYGSNQVGCRNSPESLFCYDKPIPEEIIEKPVGLSLAEKKIGDNPCCFDCQAKGVLLCATCSGSGLYVDSIMESQGIIVKVRCLGCGGTGNIMCLECGGRGHL